MTFLSRRGRQLKLTTAIFSALVCLGFTASAYAQTAAPAAAAPAVSTPATPAPAATATPAPAGTDATAPKKPLTPQQQKFSACSKDAHSKSLTGDDRKTFMSTCLKGSGTTSAATAAKKAKRKDCVAQAKAKSLTGDDKKKFISTCVKA